mmetsp:Transcript_68252/g.102934  ORF Transcript_68252/g.102934 Transcript_68252/m.102934 type:complete len:707 (-) Transcript_68252:194-2314(-)
MPSPVTESVQVPFRKRRIIHDDEDDADSSSSVSFQSPSSTVNGNGHDEDFLPADDIRADRGATFALPAAASQDDSDLVGHYSQELLATQPFRTQPSTPSDTAATTTTTTKGAKLKRRKVSMSPTDSLAKNNNDNQRRRISPRKAPQSNLQEVIEIDDDDEDDGGGGGKANLGMTMEDVMKMPIPRKGANVNELVAIQKPTSATLAQAIATEKKASTPPSKVDKIETFFEESASLDSKQNPQEKKHGEKSKSPDPEKTDASTKRHPGDSMPKAAVEEVPKQPRNDPVPSSKVQGIETPKKSSTVASVGTESTRRSGRRKTGNSSSLETAAVEEAPNQSLPDEATPEPKKKKTPKATKATTTKAKKKKGASTAASEADNASASTSPAPKKSKGKKQKKAPEENAAAAPPPKKKAKKGANAKQPPQMEEARPSENSAKASKGTATSTNSTLDGSHGSDNASKPAPAEAKIVAKKKKRTFQDQLLHKMFMSCKPYTVKILAQEMKSNESSINFCMLSLTDKGWIVKKEFTSKGGRSKELYWANQTAKSKELYDALCIVPPHAIQATQEELTRLQQEEKELTHQLTQITDGPSNEQLGALLTAAQSEVTELEKKREAMHSRIRQATTNKKPTGLLSKGRKQPPAKKSTPKTLKTRINKMRDEWRKRKNKCMDFIDQLADGMEKKVKDVVKLLELETDESEGVKMPPKHVIE